MVGPREKCPKGDECGRRASSGRRKGELNGLTAAAACTGNGEIEPLTFPTEEADRRSMEEDLVEELMARSMGEVLLRAADEVVRLLRCPVEVDADEEDCDDDEDEDVEDDGLV